MYLNVLIATNFEKYGIEIFNFSKSPNVYHTWYRLGHTVVYIGTLHIFIRLSVYTWASEAFEKGGAT